ncbi:MAG TPA: hypothetical protein VHP32_06790 [Ignavibacteria bacterium]|nr:hypothetical protein [Ignavibacteria bacterium]
MTNINLVVNGTEDKNKILKKLKEWSNECDRVYEISILNTDHLSYKAVLEIAKTIKIYELNIKINITVKKLEIKQLLLLSSVKRSNRKFQKKSFMDFGSVDAVNETQEIIDTADELDFFEKETNFTEKRLRDFITKKENLKEVKILEFMKDNKSTFTIKNPQASKKTVTPQAALVTQATKEEVSKPADKETTNTQSNTAKAAQITQTATEESSKSIIDETNNEKSSAAQEESLDQSLKGLISPINKEQEDPLLKLKQEEIVTI